MAKVSIFADTILQHDPDEVYLFQISQNRLEQGLIRRKTICTLTCAELWKLKGGF